MIAAGSSVRAGHAVRAYHDETEHARAVADFLAQGIRRGDAALVVAIDAHARAISRALKEAVGPAADRVIYLDAARTLEEISVLGTPHSGRFHAVIGGVLARLPLSVRIYGEMVDLLWKAGRLESALRLERLWGSLMKQRPFNLLCGYGMDLLERPLEAASYAEACGAHLEVLPQRDPGRLRSAVHRALEAVWGPAGAADLRALMEATIPPDPAPLPAAELWILWILRLLPARAGEVLAEARRQFEELPPDSVLLPAAEPPPQPLRILYAEDDPNDVFFMRHILEKLGRPVTLDVSEDGILAEQRLSDPALPPPDLALLDLKLPRKDGLELLSWIRTRPELRGLPVALFTSSSERSDVDRAYENGADLYLAKPQGTRPLGDLLRGLLAYLSASRS